MMAGAAKCRTRISMIRVHSDIPVPLMDAYVANGPTRPAVPIPAPSALLVILSTMVETGPRIAAVSVGASHMTGFLAILPICSIDVPKP